MFKVIAAVIKFFRKEAPALPDLDGVGSIAVKLAQQELKAAIAMEAALVASGGYVAFWLDPRRYDQPWDKWLLEPYPDRKLTDLRDAPSIEWDRLIGLQDAARAQQQIAYDQQLVARGLLQSSRHFHNIHRPSSKKRFDVLYGMGLLGGYRDEDS